MKNSNANIHARHQRILSYLAENNFVDTSTLAVYLNVSPITVRRDLAAMREKGLLDYKSGIVTLKSTLPSEDDHTKRLLAWKACEYIEDGDTVLINSSRTVSYCVEYINKSNVQVITDNILTLQRSISTSVSLFVTGGQYHSGQASLTGGVTLQQLEKVVGTKCILGVSGISYEGGITSPFLEEAYVNAKMIEQTTGPVIIAAEGTKLGKQDHCFVADISKISILITDQTADTNQLSVLQEHGVKVIVVSTAQG